VAFCDSLVKLYLYRHTTPGGAVNAASGLGVTTTDFAGALTVQAPFLTVSFMMPPLLYFTT